MTEPSDSTQPPEAEHGGPTTGYVTESETDRLAAAVTGPDDQVGMAALWRVTMQLDRWWFLAVGEEGEESPAAAEIDGQQMLLAFTDAERVRHFAVEQQMIAEADDLQAIALEPAEVVEAADAYTRAHISGLLFDPHISGYYIPAEQLQIVWDAVMAPDTGDSQPIPVRNVLTQEDADVTTGMPARSPGEEHSPRDDRPGPNPA